MEQEQTAAGTHPAFHSLHLTPEELAQLSPDDLLQACLEYHRLLQTIMGILTTPDASLTMRVVAIDLLFAQALQIAQGKTPDEISATWKVPAGYAGYTAAPARIKENAQKIAEETKR